MTIFDSVFPKLSPRIVSTCSDCWYVNTLKLMQQFFYSDYGNVLNRDCRNVLAKDCRNVANRIAPKYCTAIAAICCVQRLQQRMYSDCRNVLNGDWSNVLLNRDYEAFI